MATIDLGKVSITPRGTWDANAAYEPLDVVLYGGSSYIAIAETVGNPPTDTRYFSLLAAKGDPGSDADVTAENIKSALGYTAADARSLSALWKLSQGVVYDFESDATEAYAKTVPTGAKACTVKSIGGKTVVWNQLLEQSKFPVTKTENGITFTNNGDGSISVNGTATDFSEMRLYDGSDYRSLFIVGHKYLLTGAPSGCSSNCYLQVWDSINAEWMKDLGTGTIGQFQNEATGNCAIRIRILGGTTVENLVFKPRIFDLTKLFGSGNEPTSVDDPRIAWGEQYAEEHPEYNAGELVSADVESVLYNDAVVSDIPPAVRSLPGYGWSAGTAYNSIERTDEGRWLFVQRVGEYTFSGKEVMSITKLSDYQFVYIEMRGITPIIDGTFGLISAEYTTASGSYTTFTSDKMICGYASKNYNITRIAIRDDECENVEAFRSKLNGKKVYVELAEHVTTDITDRMAGAVDPFAVEAGGTVTFRNSAMLAVPSDAEYVIKLSEVNAS